MPRDADDQLEQFLRFMKSKTELAVQAVDTDFEDTKSDSLGDDVLNKDDVVSTLSSLKESVKSSVRSEMQRHYRMAALLLKQLLEQGVAQDVDLALDLDAVEDEALQKETEKLMIRSSSPKKEEKRTAKLVSIKDEHQRLIQDVERLEKQNEQLKEKLERVQEQATRALGERSRLNEERESSRKSGEETDLAVNRLKKQLEEAEDKLRRYESKAKESAEHISQSKQFQQLKKMLAQKNEQLLAARKIIQRYDPKALDDIAHEEDDD